MSDDREVVVEPAKEPDDKEARRLKKALSTLQKEKESIEKQLADFRKEIEDAKLSEQQRAAKEVEALRAEKEAAISSRTALEKELEKERRISTLVAKYDLADPEFGDILLRRIGPEDDLDTFIRTAKKDEKLSRLFKGPNDNRITNEDGSAIVPGVAPGAAPRSRSAASGPLDEDLEIAMDLFPNDANRRQAYLDRLKKIKGSK